LPFSPYPPSKPSSCCIQLIKDARTLWELPFLGGIVDSTASDYPSIDEILNWLSDFNLDYPKERILTARMISDGSIHIWQYSIIQDARKDWYEKDNGEFVPANTMASVWETAVKHARNYLHQWNYAKQKDGDTDYAWIDFDYIEGMPDYAILAILAIDAARFLLKGMLYYKEDEDSPYIGQQLQEATDLLRKAEEIKGKEEEIKAEKAEIEIENMKPDAERGARVLQGAKSGGYAKGKSEDIKERYKAWQQEAERIWNEKPEASKVFVAGAIVKRFHKEGKTDLLKDKESIRKIIKNPLPKKSGKMPA
jgi:hypothetical protein